MNAETIRDAVAELAATPMQMPMERWNVVSNMLLSAADEIDRLRAQIVIPDGFERGWNEGVENAAQFVETFRDKPATPDAIRTLKL